jgi:TrmH family RNA methyltransferase
MITSTQNPKIQWVRALQTRSRHRREAGVFVVEGIRLAEEALRSGWEARIVLHTEELSERGMAVVDGYTARGRRVERVSGEVMRAASDTQTPQGILIALPITIAPIPEKLDFVLIPDGVRDPGNLGSMLRTAAAAGVGAAFIPAGNVDVFAPKVVRAAMGAHFRLPIINAEWETIHTHLVRRNIHIFLGTSSGGIDYSQANFREPMALIIGSEAQGAGKAASELARTRVNIPMDNAVESLNAAAAAAVLLFEVVRQRNQPTIHPT